MEIKNDKTDGRKNTYTHNLLTTSMFGRLHRTVLTRWCKHTIDFMNDTCCCHKICIRNFRNAIPAIKMSYKEILITISFLFNIVKRG